MKSGVPILLTGFNGIAGLTLVGMAIVAALLSHIATPYDPVALDFGARLSAPSAAHWLGTDQFGRDVFSRLISAASVSISISALSVAFALVVGVSVGAVSGYFGGILDRSIMMLTDGLMAIPGLLLALGLTAAFGQNKWGVVLALGISYSPGVIRIVRGSTLSLKAKEYVEASRAMGNGDLYTIARHIVPNCIGTLTVVATTFCAHAVLAESALSFLGLGVPPPYPSWGGMLADARNYLVLAPWLVIAPGLAIAFTVFGNNLLGDALRDRFDPRMALS